MKSDEEFIAGIYQKAEERKIAEANTVRQTQSDGKLHHSHTWYGVAAAACVCLIVSGAVYAGRSGQAPDGAYSEQENAGTGEESAVMALSEDDSMVSGAGRSMQEDVTAYSAQAPVQEEMQGRGRSAGPDGYGMPKEKLESGAYAGLMLAMRGRAQFPAAENGADARETGGN